MPIKPGPTETKEEFISRCIGEEITAGYEQSQAAAICYSKWDRGQMSKQKYADPQRRVMAKINFEKKYEGINLAPLEKGPNDPCWDGYVQVGTKDMDGREVPNCVPLEAAAEEVIQLKGIKLQEGESYPWEECIADQTERYGDEETAKKVCGYIKSKYGS